MESSRALKEVLEAARALSAEEQARLRRALDSSEETAEAAFAHRMAEEGLLERPRTSAAAAAASFEPVPVRGQSVSAAIIEGRR